MNRLLNAVMALLCVLTIPLCLEHNSNGHRNGQ